MGAAEDPLTAAAAIGRHRSDPGWSSPVRLLGPLEVGDAGHLVELGSPKQKALLAILLLHAGEIVATDRLIEMVWDGHPPRTAAHSIQMYVSELRKAFDGQPWTPVIETRPPGYRLVIDPELVDFRRFCNDVEEGLASLANGDQARAAAVLRAAVGTWRGDPLADFAYAEFAQPHIRRLTELRRDAIERLASIELDAGNVHEAMQHIEQLVAEDPLRERGMELLMTALYRSGRHVQALRAYQRFRHGLGEELGVVPSPSLERLNERILLHDPTLMPQTPKPASIRASARNPYKGLRPFREADAGDYFGREELVEAMVERLRSDQRLVALVGPSGSGKSSAVAAGLLPRLRAGDVTGSDRWVIAVMTPGAHPLQEAEAVMTRAAATATPDDLRPRPLPPPWGPYATNPRDHVLLVIDQFEELFLAADAASTRRFLDVLQSAITDPDGRLTVVLTLRADHYDRPLLHAGFADVFTTSVLNVLPMTASELNAAVTRPAELIGVGVEPELIAEIVSDTIDQPGSLPLLQYALAEQFDRRTRDVLTIDDYTAQGGLRAILSRRADQVFESLTADQQHVARQVLMRMVRVGSAGPDACRRVSMSELSDLAVDPVWLSEVLERFGRHRLLSFDADPVTGRATVGVAHEALLDEWERLAGWIDRHRPSLRRYEALRAAAADWDDSGRHVDYLLAGVRLAEVESWPADGVPGLTSSEREFIAASVMRERADADAEAARSTAERRLVRRARRRLLALSTAVLLLVVAAIAMMTAGDDPHVDRVTLFYHDSGEVSDLVESGFDRAVSEFGFTSQEVDVSGIADASLLDQVSDQQQLVIDFTLETDVDAVAAAHPDTRFIVLDRPASAPNVRSIAFAVNEGSYLAGAAAALTSSTGTIGFIGGVDIDSIWQFHAGFEAGARAVDPDVRILSTYLARPPDYPGGFLAPAAGEDAATTMYQSGADVIFAAAGMSGLGVFQAAADLSEPAHHLWAIGVDSDQYMTVGNLPGTVAFESWQPHILTSVIKRYDTAVYDALAAQSRGDAEAGSVVLGLASDGVDLSYSGGFITPIRTELEALRRAIVTGDITVPCRPIERSSVAAAQDSTCRS